MTPPSLAQQERNTLCDLFVQHGSEAPTLCEGRSTADLAAHLAVTKNRGPTADPDASAPAGRLHRQRPPRGAGSHALGELVEKVRRGHRCCCVPSIGR